MKGNPDSAEFWDKCYQAGKTPWDFQWVPLRLKLFLGEVGWGRVLIPSCGSGYEIAAFLKAGHEVTALDFSAAAVERARSRPENKGAILDEADFFTARLEPNSFDLVYERTFLCALDPSYWPHYAERMQNLLRRGGSWVGYFSFGVEPEPPPHPLKEETAQVLFGGGFERIIDEPVTDSLPLFQGRERWLEWRKLPIGAETR